MPDPIHQFEIKHYLPLEIFGIDASFTNAALYMVLTVAVTFGFLMYATRGRSLVPTRLQSVAELAYEFIAKMVRDATGKDGMRFFPLVFTLFMFILIANLLSMAPGSFTVMSHIAVTAALALVVFATVLISGFLNHGLGFFKLFVPSGVPIYVLPVVSLIEVVSFLSRPVSHSVRLFASMLAGHITLKVFAGFAVMLVGSGSFAAMTPLPVLMAIAITALEFLVCFLQAYIFAMLTCMYLNDALHPSH